MKDIKNFINEAIRIKGSNDYVELAHKFIDSVSKSVYKSYLNDKSTNPKAKSMGYLDGEYECLSDFRRYCIDNDYYGYSINDSESNDAPEEWFDALNYLSNCIYHELNS